MAQYHCAEFIMKKFTEQLATPLIRQMSPVSHNPAFQRIRVYARFEHMNIMICLQQQSIKSLQLLHNLIIIISQIGYYRKGTVFFFIRYATGSAASCEIWIGVIVRSPITKSSCGTIS